jgi:hypothetical protein
MPEHHATLYRFRHERRDDHIRGPAVGASPGSTCEGVDAMGRGRQKAKQTKVARELKYFSPDTDYDALQHELAGNGHAVDQEHTSSDDDSEDDHADESSERR